MKQRDSLDTIGVRRIEDERWSEMERNVKMEVSNGEAWEIERVSLEVERKSEHLLMSTRVWGFIGKKETREKQPNKKSKCLNTEFGHKILQFWKLFSCRIVYKLMDCERFIPDFLIQPFNRFTANLFVVIFVNELHF